MLIFGNGEFAQVAARYMDNVTGFCVHKSYLKDVKTLWYETVAFEGLEIEEPLFIAVGNNAHRHRIYREAKVEGHPMQTYVHRSTEMRDSSYGEHCFILENNILQVCRVGINTVLWTGNHVGHHSCIGNHCFITSHVCIGGGAEIGDYSFIGMNATVFDHVKIGKGCIIAAGAVADRDIPDNHTLSRKGALVPNEVAQAR